MNIEVGLKGEATVVVNEHNICQNDEKRYS